jgi:hypothetical protein
MPIRVYSVGGMILAGKTSKCSEKEDCQIVTLLSPIPHGLVLDGTRSPMVTDRLLSQPNLFTFVVD